MRTGTFLRNVLLFQSDVEAGWLLEQQEQGFTAFREQKPQMHSFLKIREFLSGFLGSQHQSGEWEWAASVFPHLW